MIVYTYLYVLYVHSSIHLSICPSVCKSVGILVFCLSVISPGVLLKSGLSACNMYMFDFRLKDVVLSMLFVCLCVCTEGSR